MTICFISLSATSWQTIWTTVNCSWKGQSGGGIRYNSGRNIYTDFLLVFVLSKCSFSIFHLLYDLFFVVCESEIDSRVSWEVTESRLVWSRNLQEVEVSSTAKEILKWERGRVVHVLSSFRLEATCKLPWGRSQGRHPFENNTLGKLKTYRTIALTA